MFLCHTDITDFTDIFRITKKARLRALFIEPCSHCQPDARSASKAGRRKARRDNHTNEGAQTWLFHTENTDDTDIFSNTNCTNSTNEGAQTWLYHTDSTDFTDIFCEHESHESRKRRGYEPLCRIKISNGI